MKGGYMNYKYREIRKKINNFYIQDEQPTICSPSEKVIARNPLAKQPVNGTSSSICKTP